MTAEYALQDKIRTISMPSAYVLTIEENDGPRCLHAKRELASLDLAGRFVKGFQTGDPELSIYSPALNLLLAKRSLTTGEIAVYAGHRKIWQSILDDGAPHALVFEDDFHVTDQVRFRAALADCLSAPWEWDIVKFFDFNPKSVVSRVKVGDTLLVTHKFVAAGAVAYLISREAAQKLLRRKTIFRPVDEDFSWPWELGLRIRSVSPNLVEEVSHDLGGSQLESARAINRSRRPMGRRLWANCLQGWKLVRSHSYGVGR